MRRHFGTDQHGGTGSAGPSGEPSQAVVDEVNRNFTKKLVASSDVDDDEPTHATKVKTRELNEDFDDDEALFQASLSKSSGKSKTNKKPTKKKKPGKSQAQSGRQAEVCFGLALQCPADRLQLRVSSLQEQIRAGTIVMLPFKAPSVRTSSASLNDD